MAKASIGIFEKNLDYGPTVSCPNVSDDVFKAVEEVLETKGEKIVKANDGFYMVKYSESGPFNDILIDDFLPVYVARISKWSSGGVRKKEMEEWKNGA